MNRHAVAAIYRFEMARTFRTLTQSIASPVLSTSLYFIVFGSAIGSRMGEVDGVSYGAFIIPGLVMLSLLNESISNASFGIYMPKWSGTIYELLSAPVVQGVISDSGTITGLGLDRARELVVQLNAGALPLQLTVLQEQTVDATLGEDSVQQSVLAGEIGLMLVALFMILYYRLPGLISAGALGIYTVLTLAVFKLVPVTLTLAGIGAFVLSVGMAVDANILIFERLKEEMRAGRSYAAAIDAGFSRAWPSIRDGVMRLSHAQFEALFAGLDWRRVRAVTARAPQAVA